MLNYWINCFIKWIAFTEHVQLWTRHDIECTICYWTSYTFSLYDLFETWSLIRNYKTSIASWYWHDYSNQLLYQKKCIYRTLNASRYRWDVLVIYIVKKLHLSCYWLSDTFSLYVLIMTTYSWLDHICDCFLSYLWLFLCQYRYLVIDVWILKICF